MKNTLLIMAAICLSSCASHELIYKAPNPSSVENQKEINKAFSTVWSKIVEGLAKNNFTIDSVNKDSGLIVASKKLNPPSSYADCGGWKGHFKNMRVDEHYMFLGADSANYVFKNKDTFVAVQRVATLTSKSNIFVKKISATKTSVQVNGTFNLEFDSNFSAYVYPQGQVYSKDKVNIDWTTAEKGKLSNGQTECYSNSALENEILNLGL